MLSALESGGVPDAQPVTFPVRSMYGGASGAELRALLRGRDEQAGGRSTATITLWGTDPVEVGGWVDRI